MISAGTIAIALELIDQVSQNVEAVKREFRSLEQDVIDAGRRAGQSVEDLGGSVRDMAGRMREGQRASDQAAQTLRRDVTGGAEAARRALDAVGRQADETADKMRRSERAMEGLRTVAVGMGQGVLENIGGLGFDLVVENIGRAISFVKDSAFGLNATLESTTLQFETLMGSAERAREHVAGLFEFAERTPFETGPIIEASRLLETFGGAALNTRETLTILGDAAASTNAPIQELGMWVGRAYAAIQAGRPFGEAAQRLNELAVLTPQARAEMEALREEGASASEIWQVMLEDLSRFTGGMEAQASTWQGVISTALDGISLAISTGFRPVFEGVRDGLSEFAQFLSSQSFSDFAQGFANRMRDVVGAIRGFIADNRREIGDLVTSLGGLVRSVGGLTGSLIRLGDQAGVFDVVFGGVSRTSQLVSAISDSVQSIIDRATELLGIADEVEGEAQSDTSFFGGMWNVFRDNVEKTVGILDTGFETLIVFAGGQSDADRAMQRAIETHLAIRREIQGHTDDLDRLRRTAQETEPSQKALASGLEVTRDIIRLTSRATADLDVGLTDLSEGFDLAKFQALQLNQSMSDLQVVNDIMNQRIDDAANAISHWEDRVGGVDEALGYLDEQLAAGNITAEEHAEKVAKLEEFKSRLQRGIEDDLIPAFIDEQLAAADLQMALDDLDQKLKDGTISQQEHAEQSAALREEFEKQQNPVGALIDKIGELIDTLIELEGQDPTIDIDANTQNAINAVEGFKDYLANNPATIDLFVRQANAIGFTSRASGGPLQAGELALVGERGPELFVPTTPGHIVPNHMLAGARHLADGTVGSPSASVSLALGFDWDFLFAGLEAAAEKYTGGALEHIKTFVGVAQAAFRALKAEIELAELASQFQASGGALPSGTFVGQLTSFSQTVTETVGESASQFSTEFLDATGEYVDAAEAGVGLLTEAVGLITSISGLEFDLASAQQSVSNLKFITEQIVKDLGDSAAYVNANNPDGFVQQGDTYAQSAVSGVELLRKAAEFLAALEGLTIDMGRARGAVSNLKFITEQIVKDVGDSAAFVNATNPEGFVQQAGTYAEGAEQAVSLVLKGLEFIVALTEFEGRIDRSQAEAFASELKFVVEHIAFSIGDSARFLASERPDDFLEQMRTYVDAVGPALGLVESAVSVLEAIAEHADGFDVTTRQVQDFALAVAGVTRILAEGFRMASAGWTDVENEITDFTDDAGASLGLVDGALGIIDSLTSFNPEDLSVQQVQDFALAVAGVARIVAEGFRLASAGWGEKADPAIQAFADDAGASLGLIQQAADAIDAILNWGKTDDDDEGLTPGTVKERAERIAEDIRALIEVAKEIADDYQGEGTEAWETFSRAASQAMDMVQSAIEAINATAEMSELTPEMAETLVDNWVILLDAFEEIARLTEERGLEAAEDTLETVEAIARTIQAASSTIDGIGPSGGGRTSGSSSGSVHGVFTGSGGRSGRGPNRSPGNDLDNVRTYGSMLVSDVDSYLTDQGLTGPLADDIEAALAATYGLRLHFEPGVRSKQEFFSNLLDNMEVSGGRLVSLDDGGLILGEGVGMLHREDFVLTPTAPMLDPLVDAIADRLERRGGFGGGFTNNNYFTLRRADPDEIAREAETAMRYAARDPRLARVGR